MSNTHNKKRNIGIIYELLLRHISDRLIVDDKRSAQKALRIIEKRFDKSTELYREFRLFNALAKTTVSDSAIAAAILTEAKSAARRCDHKRLNREKSLLIRDINHILNDKNFYHRRIPEYKTYATIHTLLGDWRKKDRSDLARMVKYESLIVEWLLEDKKENINETKEVENVDKLVVSLMTEKINKKYSNNLTKEQKDIISEYSIVQSKGKTETSKYFLSLKKKTKNSLLKLKRKTSNSILLEKIDKVSKKIDIISDNDFSDDTIIKYLTISSLNNRIKEEINGK